jgi:hypothetical protein
MFVLLLFLCLVRVVVAVAGMDWAYLEPYGFKCQRFPKTTPPP